LLLRHLDGCRDRRPVTSNTAIAELTRHSPGYIKGLPAARLAERIGLEEVRQACTVESALAAFLSTIGFA